MTSCFIALEKNTVDSRSFAETWGDVVATALSGNERLFASPPDQGNKGEIGPGFGLSRVVEHGTLKQREGAVET